MRFQMWLIIPIITFGFFASANQPEPDLVKIFSALSLDTKWKDVPSDVKAQLEAVTETRRHFYDLAWGTEGLNSKRKILQESATLEMNEALNKFVRDVFPNQVSSDFKASEGIQNPILLSSLKDFLLVQAANGGWRSLNVHLDKQVWRPAEYLGYSMPSLESASAAKALSGEALTRLKQIKVSELSEIEKTLLNRLQLKLVSAHSGSTDFYGLGGDDQFTSVGRVFSANSVIASYKVIKDLPEFLKQATSFWLYPVTQQINAGTVEATTKVTFPLQMGEKVILSRIGDPKTNLAAKAFTLLGRWFIEKLNERPDAQGRSWGLDIAKQQQMWKSVQSDLLIPLSDQGTIADFQKSFQEFVARETLASQNAAITAIEAVFPKGNSLLSEPAKLKVIAAIEEQKTFGTLAAAIPRALDHATGNTEASTLFQTELKAVGTVGGFDRDEDISDVDRAKIIRIWSEIKTYLTKKYSGGLVDLGKILPEEITLSTTAGSATDAIEGNITFNVAAPMGLASVYGVLLHEAKHSIDRRTGMAKQIEGSAWEGAAQLVEFYVTPQLIDDVYGNDLKKASLLKLGLNETKIRISSRTEALLAVFTAGPKEDGLEICNKIGEKWGISPAGIQVMVQRAHQGLQYVQYLGGTLIYADLLDYLQKHVQPTDGRIIDPFVIQMYLAGDVEKNEASASKLKKRMNAVIK